MGCSAGVFCRQRGGGLPCSAWRVSGLAPNRAAEGSTIDEWSYLCEGTIACSRSAGEGHERAWGIFKFHLVAEVRDFVWAACGFVVVVVVVGRRVEGGVDDRGLDVGK